MPVRRDSAQGQSAAGAAGSGVDLGGPGKPPSRMRTERRYNHLVFGGALAACLLFAVAHSAVDPWRVTPAPWRIAALEPYLDFIRQGYHAYFTGPGAADVAWKESPRTTAAKNLQ